MKRIYNTSIRIYNTYKEYEIHVHSIQHRHRNILPPKRPTPTSENTAKLNTCSE